MDTWGDVWATKAVTPSWQDVLSPEERQGGGTPWGSSRWAVFERCEYLYWLKYVKRMKLAEPSHPLEIGGLVHECLAAYFQTFLDWADDESSKACDQACLESMFRLVDLNTKPIPHIANEARRLLQGWLVINGPGTSHDERARTLAVEAFAEVNRDGFPYSTRFDRLLWDPELDGVVIEETKTASRYSESLLLGYRMDPQFLGQQYVYRRGRLDRKYGPLRGYRVNLIVKTKGPDVYQETVPILVPQIRDWMQDKKRMWSRLVLCEAEGRWPKRRANCVMYGRRCEAHDHCACLGKGAGAYRGWVKKEDWEV